MKNLFFLLLCLFCISTETTLYAQKDIFLNEFTDSTMFNFVGTAQLFNKRIRLTEAKNFQGGGIWLKDKKNVANDFAIEANVLVPRINNTSFYRNTFGDCTWQYGFTVRQLLRVKHIRRWHRDNTHGMAFCT